MRSSFKGLYLFLCGVCMGASDLVPGISGGTIAFIMGFYTPLLESLKSFNYDAVKLLFSGQWQKFFVKTQCRFLLPLLSGILFSFVLLVNVIHFLLNHPDYRIYLYSAFLGLVLASFYFCIKQVKKWTRRTWCGLGCGSVIAFALTTLSLQNNLVIHPYAIKIDLPSDTSLANNYQTKDKLLTNLSAEDLSLLVSKRIVKSSTDIYNRQGEFLGSLEAFANRHKNVFFSPWLMFCGALAICALLLPGISGSYILTLLGVYPLIIGSLADWVTHLKNGHFDFESFTVLLNLGMGIIIGVICFSRLLSWLLKTYTDVSLATLSGFMIGALRSVWPFWTYNYTLLPTKLEKGLQIVPLAPVWPHLYSIETALALVGLLAGFGIFLIIEHLASHKQIKISI